MEARGDYNVSEGLPRCNASGKWKDSYPSLEEATRSMLARPLPQAGALEAPRFVYECESCGHFHFATSSHYNRKRAGQRVRRRKGNGWS